MEKCGACGNEVRVDELQAHLASCEFRMEKCGGCGNEVKLAEMQMEAHLANHRSVLCPACPQGTAVEQEAFQDHFNRERHSMHVFSALNTATSKTGQLKTEVVTMKNEILKRIHLQEIKMAGLSSGELNIEQQVRPLFEQLAQTVHSIVDTKLDICETNAQTLYNVLEKVISDKLVKLETDYRNMKDEIDSSLQRINALEQTFRVRELGQKFTDNNPLVSYDGVFIWKFTDFSQKLQEAKQGRNICHYTTPFFTSQYGYKICARLYPNGDRMGEGTHLSVFFVVMKGDYDALQEWPFKQRVTFCLMNQERGSHVVDSFRPDPTSSSFCCPQNNMNIASGCPLFVRLDDLVNPSSGLLKDDTFFLKISVDRTDIHDPGSLN